MEECTAIAPGPCQDVVVTREHELRSTVSVVHRGDRCVVGLHGETEEIAILGLKVLKHGYIVDRCALVCQTRSSITYIVAMHAKALLLISYME